MLPNLPLAAIIAASTINIASGSNNNNRNYLSFNQLQQDLSPDPHTILENLNEYSKLWISVPKRSTSGNCVWSECALDDETDDSYKGDYRDGDEQWYQYRTQNFCANAAYTLYGERKDEAGRWGDFGRCSKRHYINSYFTYGGADNLLKSIGVEPIVYVDDGSNNANGRKQRKLEDANANAANDDATDDGYSYTSANSMCVEIDYEEENQEGQDDRQDHRFLSGSHDSGDNQGHSSSLGCSSDGSYILAAFQGGSCDGNYFVEAIDTIQDYNDQHGHIGCHKVWTSKTNSISSNSDGNYTDDDYYMSIEMSNPDYDAIYALLRNSWTCDTRLYPNECPDPHGIKARYEYALRTAAHGGNAQWALKNEELRAPIRALSWALLVLTFCVLVLTYVVKNRKRIDSRVGLKTSKNKRTTYLYGLLMCMKEDIENAWKWFSAKAVKAFGFACCKMNTEVEKAKARIATEVNKRKSKKRSNRKVGVTVADEDNDDDFHIVQKVDKGVAVN